MNASAMTLATMRATIAERTAERDALRAVVRGLLQWAEHTGGWDAPIWARAGEFFPNGWDDGDNE